MESILYRSDDLSYSDTSAVKVMAFEITELLNTDIPDTVLMKYGNRLSSALCNKLQTIIQQIEDDEVDEKFITETLTLMLDELSELFGFHIKYAVWLCDKETAIDYYGADEDSVCSFKTSPCILSDLGEDGILFGYEEEPEAL